jgi:hypothetical protein
MDSRDVFRGLTPIDRPVPARPTGPSGRPRRPRHRQRDLGRWQAAAQDRDGGCRRCTSTCATRTPEPLTGGDGRDEVRASTGQRGWYALAGCARAPGLPWGRCPKPGDVGLVAEGSSRAVLTRCRWALTRQWPEQYRLSDLVTTMLALQTMHWIGATGRCARRSIRRSSFVTSRRHTLEQARIF